MRSITWRPPKELMCEDSDSHSKQVHIFKQFKDKNTGNYLRCVHNAAIVPVLIPVFIVIVIIFIFILAVLLVLILTRISISRVILGESCDAQVRVVMDRDRQLTTLALVVAWGGVQLAHGIGEIIPGQATAIIGLEDVRKGSILSEASSGVLSRGPLDLGVPGDEILEWGLGRTVERKRREPSWKRCSKRKNGGPVQGT